MAELLQLIWSILTELFRSRTLRERRDRCPAPSASPKTKSGRNGDEGRRGQRVILCFQRAERRERSAHLCLTTDAFSLRYNNARSIAEADADAARQKR